LNRPVSLFGRQAFFDKKGGKKCQLQITDENLKNYSPWQTSSAKKFHEQGKPVERPGRKATGLSP
jgi:hypothetical protein